MEDKILREICKNCGCTFGSHHGGTSPYPYNYCPGHENGMDWDEGPGTCFKSTGTFKDDELEHVLKRQKYLKMMDWKNLVLKLKGGLRL